MSSFAQAHAPFYEEARLLHTFGAVGALVAAGAVYLIIMSRIAPEKNKDNYRVPWDILWSYNAFVNYAQNAVTFVVAYSLLTFYTGSSVSFGKVDITFSTNAFHSTFAEFTGQEWFLFCAVWILSKLFLVILIDASMLLVYLKMPRPAFLNIYDDDQKTREAYEMLKIYICDPHSKGVDLGFNFYDGDYKLSPHDAQIKKFEHAFKLLGLKEGMRVMDIGCGFGDWLYWLKTEKGCKVYGLNLTLGQADVVEDRGIPCLRGRWQKFHALAKARDPEFCSRFEGQFDAVSAWDTIEHYVNGRDTWNKPVIHRTYRDLFQLAHFFIDETSSCGGFWTSTLHRNRMLCRDFLGNPGLTFKEWGNCWLMTLTYSGCYPGKLPWSSLSGRAKPQFELEHEENRIEDYRMTSLLCDNHFGNFRFTRDFGNLRIWYITLVFSVATAHFPYLIWNSLRTEPCWMWHVGGIEEKRAVDCPCDLLWQKYKKQKNVEHFAD